MGSIGEKCEFEASKVVSEMDLRFYLVSGGFARDKNLQLVSGVCLPASCSLEKVLRYANKILANADLEAFSVTCKTNDPLPFDWLDVFAM